MRRVRCVCARAVSGQAAAAPPSSVMNSRLLMPHMGLVPLSRRKVYRSLRWHLVPLGHQLVLPKTCPLPQDRPLASASRCVTPAPFGNTITFTADLYIRLGGRCDAWTPA